MTALFRHLLAATAAFAVCGAAQAGDAGITRDQVRAELTAARAAGTMDRFGEIATTDDVLQARDLHNQTETLAMLARHDLLAQQQAEAESSLPASPDLASYVEAGPDGPLLVIVTFDADGVLRSAESVSLSSID